MSYPGRRDALVVAIGLVAMAIHVHAFRATYCDDALISLRYAQRLLEGHGLTWTEGVRVEGYSNLSWILGNALLGRLGVDFITATRWLGALCVAAVFGALLVRRAASGVSSVIPLAVATAAFALAAPVAAWTMAGLETPLVAALLAWGFVLLIDTTGAGPSRSRLTAAGVCFGVLNLSRPDGPLFTLVAATWIALTATPRERKTNVVSFLTWPVLLITAQLVFRRAYYDAWVPNVWYVKISPSIAHLTMGVKYVAHGLFALMPASGLAVAGLVVLMKKDPARRNAAGLLLAAMSAWLAYVAFIGGDIFNGMRHMVPFVVLMVLGLMLVVERVWLHDARWFSRSWRYVAAAIVWYVAVQYIDPSHRRAKTDTWVWNTEVVGRTFHSAFGESHPLLAVTAAGGIPYWSQLPCIDMLGLNDRVIARAAPATREHWIGHEHVDAHYVISRRPDLIHFGTAAGGEPVHGYREQLATIGAFWTDYSLCWIGGEKPHRFITRVYVDRASPRIGIIHQPDRIDIPAYFLNGAAMWNETERRFVITLRPERPLGILNVTLPPGAWGVLLPAGTEVEIIDTQTNAAAVSAVTDGSPLIEITHPLTCDVLIRTSGGNAVDLYGLTLVRQEIGR